MSKTYRIDEETKTVYKNGTTRLSNYTEFSVENGNVVFMLPVRAKPGVKATLTLAADKFENLPVKRYLDPTPETAQPAPVAKPTSKPAKTSARKPRSQAA